MESVFLRLNCYQICQTGPELAGLANIDHQQVAGDLGGLERVHHLCKFAVVILAVLNPRFEKKIKFWIRSLNKWYSCKGGGILGVVVRK